ncbi:B12-binding domain-containing radical SAM protein [Pseudodesulfovibrio methanolicus]|uniref:Radical SAM protein n=1 Tax=Pseudodesulfovibrio methanolicus TaxID=3126690 RepID=A0ABZ2IWR2_9BACT
MANVLLVLPSILSNENDGIVTKTTASFLPPLGLASIAAVLRENGHGVAIIDGVAEHTPLQEIVDRARDFDIVGVSAMTAHAKRAHELIRMLRSQLDKPIMAGGVHATTMPAEFLENGADFVVVGEGEMTTLELAQALDSGLPRERFAEIRGLCLLRDGELFRTPRRPLIEDLDSLPQPARDLLPMHLYSATVARTTRQPSHMLLASRGCPGVCSFCVHKLFGKKVRYNSPERIIDEFLLLVNEYGAKDVAIFDDNFAANREMVIKVCNKLIELDLDLTWSIESRVDNVDREILELLAKAGCTFIAYGIESGSQRVLDQMNKGVTLDQIREAVRITNEVGIKTRGYLMLGHLDETPEEMRKTIEFAKSLDLDVASFTLFVPLPGTQDYKRAQKFGQFDPQFYMKDLLLEYNMPKYPVYVPAGMTSEELMAIHREAYNKLYLRPGYIFKKLFEVRNFHDVRSLVKGGLTVMSNFFRR